MPWRPLNVTAAKMRLTHTFRSKDADSAVSFNDNTEVASVDPRSKKMVGKLVLPFGGLGSTAGTLGNEGPFVLPRGYHVLGVAAYENYDVLHCDADFFGDARREAFDGLQHTTKYDFAKIKMLPSDGVAKRTETALKYLASKYPAEDWGYFLNQDGTVRWSDVIFTGISLESPALRACPNAFRLEHHQKSPRDSQRDFRNFGQASGRARGSA